MKAYVIEAFLQGASTISWRCVADRDLAVTAELMLCVATLWPTLDILRAT